MRKFVVALGIIGFGVLAMFGLTMSASATAFTVSPWAYACGQTAFGNPVTKQDLPGEAACPSKDTLGDATAGYAAGVLTLTKTGPTTDDLAAGATIGGLTSLSAASYDVAGGSCSGGSPRLNVVTADGKTHFFGCGPNNDPHHVTVDFSAAADGSGNGGVSSEDTVTAIDFVLDVQGTATVSNLSFTGAAAPTPTPSPSPSTSATPAPSGSATPAPSATAPVVTVIAQTGGGLDVIWPNAILVVGFLLVCIGTFVVLARRRT